MNSIMQLLFTEWQLQDCYKSMNYKSALWHFNTIANYRIYTVSLLIIVATHFKVGFQVLTTYGTAQMYCHTCSHTRSLQVF